MKQVNYLLFLIYWSIHMN